MATPRKPILIVRASLAEAPGFATALSTQFQIRHAKDAGFVPDIIAVPAHGDEQGVSIVWIHGPTAFSTPDAVEQTVNRYVVC